MNYGKITVVILTKNEAESETTINRKAAIPARTDGFLSDRIDIFFDFFSDIKLNFNIVRC